MAEMLIDKFIRNLANSQMTKFLKIDFKEDFFLREKEVYITEIA